jgi:hypothetical protein
VVYIVVERPMIRLGQRVRPAGPGGQVREISASPQPSSLPVD